MTPFKTYSLPIFLLSASLLLTMTGSSAEGMLQYNRSAIIEGQWWRLISGHFLHMGWMHLLLNQAALLIIWYFSGRYVSTQNWWGAFLFCSMAISAALFMLMPQLQWYVGLSGILHGLLAVGAISGMLRGDRESLGLFILIAIKVVWEQFSGALSSSIVVEGSIIVNAHLYGMLSGVVYITVITAAARISGRKAA